MAAKGLVLKVRLGITRSRNPAEGSESFEFVGAESTQGAISRSHLRLKLNTLSDAGLGESQYWLDSGSVYRK
ncbi:Virulence factor SrfB [compost metagenome]